MQHTDLFRSDDRKVDGEPSMTAEELQDELIRTRQQWKRDVAELEAFIEHSTSNRQEILAADDASNQVIAKLKVEVTALHERVEQLIQEKAEIQTACRRDVRELEGMVSSLISENARLKEKLNIAESNQAYAVSLMSSPKNCIKQPLEEPEALSSPMADTPRSQSSFQIPFPIPPSGGK
eukprot:gnl/MRDRNA2_/MRDRNA2_91717_c0_seq1.p1 gnl/MRDRNA2_/MRDRNA2_91717_c0~~gnl/MRDRNA2_/MRDRNA2_91717_c0_seq1.p1  ORF type:complete len:179 (+),score=39.53 gnl/MRDRNA2_/MRDRNA2_91717_c0_seq1:66-602(+)